MPHKGGPADKYGNRYEALWTVYCMVGILRQEYDLIHLEPLNTEGIEFYLSNGQSTEYHQVKRQRGTEGRWKINDLKANGVLASFWKYTSEESHLFIFVSMDGVEKLPELIDRANRSADYNEFITDQLDTKDLKDTYNYISGIVKSTTSEELYIRLKRFKIRVISEDLLRDNAETRISDFCTGSLITAIGLLFMYGMDQVHKRLNREEISDYLKANQIYQTSLPIVSNFRDYQLPPKPARFISRASIIKTLSSQFSSDNRIILIKGVDGSGKTTLITEFIEENLSRCFFFFATRDWTSTSDAFLREICEQMGQELDDRYDVNSLPHDALKDRFGRLCRQIAALGKQQKEPFYLVVDGLEYTKEEFGRSSVIDLIQLDHEGLYVFASTNRSLSTELNVHVRELDNFSPAETEKYLSFLGIDEKKSREIYNICKGLPAYLDHLWACSSIVDTKVVSS